MEVREVILDRETQKYLRKYGVPDVKEVLGDYDHIFDMLKPEAKLFWLGLSREYKDEPENKYARKIMADMLKTLRKKDIEISIPALATLGINMFSLYYDAIKFLLIGDEDAKKEKEMSQEST